MALWWGHVPSAAVVVGVLRLRFVADGSGISCYVTTTAYDISFIVKFHYIYGL